MDKVYEAAYHELEDSLWWFVGRRDILSLFLKDVSPESNILEIGCASGAFLKMLEVKGFKNVQGIDISETAINQAKRRGLHKVQIADGQRLPFADNSFDIAIASDVLEHIEDDGQTLEEWRRILRPGGKLLVFVPAHPYLWSSHDEANLHVRRYTKNMLQKRIKEAGLEVQRIGYWNILLFFPIAVIRFILNGTKRLRVPTGHQLHRLPFFVNFLITKIILLENSLIHRGLNAPAGVSLFCVAKK